MTLGGERGVAVVIALLAGFLLSALGAALLLTTSVETKIAANFRNGLEVGYAADAIAERVLADLLPAPDWNGWLDGSARSSFVDGPPGGTRLLPRGGTVDLSRVVSLANCGRPTACTSSEMVAVTTERPWGANNPRWQLYAFGSLGDVNGIATVQSDCYVVAMIADDTSENDGDPTVDGTNSGNPGSGVIALRAESFGPEGAHRALEVVLARRGSAAPASLPPTLGLVPRVRVVSWRDVER